MFKMNFTIPLSVFIALSCGSVNAADKSTAFDDAVANLAGAQSFRDAAQRNYKTQLNAAHRAQAAQQDALNNYNNATPGDDRLAAGAPLNKATQDADDAQHAVQQAHRDVQFAEAMIEKTQNQINGTNYRTQIQALQATMIGPQTPPQPTQQQTPPQPIQQQTPPQPAQQQTPPQPIQQQTPPQPTQLQTPLQPTQQQPTQPQPQIPVQHYTAALPGVTDTIQQAASSLPKNIPVDVTLGDKVLHTTVGEIAKVNPQAQISMPFVSAFTPSTRRGNNNATGNNGMRAGHEGRGADNAHSHAFGGHGYGHDNSRSEGFGGHSHFH